MNAIKQRLLWLASIGLVVTSIWACSATRNRDGSISVRFAPDMTITARGLEDALDQLTGLLDRCITGNYDRPCTAQEMREITRSIRRVLDRKGDIFDLPSTGTLPC